MIDLAEDIQEMFNDCQTARYDEQVYVWARHRVETQNFRAKFQLRSKATRRRWNQTYHARHAVVLQCKHRGCIAPKRRVQGACYCEGHASRSVAR